MKYFHRVIDGWTELHQISVPDQTLTVDTESIKGVPSATLLSIIKVGSLN